MENKQLQAMISSFNELVMVSISVNSGEAIIGGDF